jgi:hypothetical protein
MVIAALNINSFSNRSTDGVIQWTYGNVILARMERSPGGH